MKQPFCFFQTWQFHPHKHRDSRSKRKIHMSREDQLREALANQAKALQELVLRQQLCMLVSTHVADSIHCEQDQTMSQLVETQQQREKEQVGRMRGKITKRHAGIGCQTGR